jgi:two-component system, chemotaxis family, response regulator Rcp1
MTAKYGAKRIDILLVEDNPADVLLTREALSEARLPSRTHVAEDGVEALDYLRKQGKFAGAPRPDLILLDLNLPRKNGHELLAQIKADDALKAIPVVVLTTSRAPEDIARSYNLHANCYVTKPMQFDTFVAAVRSIQQFWFGVVTLPPAEEPYEPFPN